MAVACEVTAGQYTVRGLSLGGIETCMQVPQLGLCFDVGHCPRSFASTERVFISHGHADHSGGLVGMLGLRLLHGITRPLQVHAPREIAAELTDAVRAYERLQDHGYAWELTPMGAGDEVALGRRLVMRAYDAVHVVPTIGYTAWERVDKLRDEYRDLAGAEIHRLKRAGHPLFESLERPILSFPGDTTIEVLDREPHLYESRVLLLEATYLDDRKTVAQCRQHGHVHLDEVLERAGRFRNEHIVFTHFSQAYKPSEVRDIVRTRTEGRFLPAIHVLAPDSDSWPG